MNDLPLAYCAIPSCNILYGTMVMLVKILRRSLRDLYCLVINLPLFSTVVPSNICMFLSCRPFVVITTFSTDLVGVEDLIYVCFCPVDLSLL